MERTGCNQHSFQNGDTVTEKDGLWKINFVLASKNQFLICSITWESWCHIDANITNVFPTPSQPLSDSGSRDHKNTKLRDGLGCLLSSLRSCQKWETTNWPWYARRL